MSDKLINQDADTNEAADISDRYVFVMQFVGTHDKASIKHFLYILY